MEKIRHSVLLTTSCIVYHKQKILIIKYGAKKGKREGFCNWIGGHIEHGEGILENAKREIKEESGLDVEVQLKGVVHVTNFFGKNYMMHIITSQSDTDLVQNNEEGELFRVSPKDLGKYNVFENVKMFVDFIEKMSPNQVFTAKNVYDGEGKLLSFEIE